MQCPSCRAVYSNGLSSCPRCKTPASKPSPESETNRVVNTEESIQASANSSSTEIADESSPAPVTSTLLEFPGVSRASRPQWRKELSERVREIQERRAREAGEAGQRPVEQPATTTSETSVPQLGLVPQPEVPEVNPIVAAALKRLERARQPSPPVQRPRASMGRGAVVAATARVAEEQFETETAKPVIVQTPTAAPSAKTEVAPQVKTLERERLLTRSEEHTSELQSRQYL